MVTCNTVSQVLQQDCHRSHHTFIPHLVDSLRHRVKNRSRDRRKRPEKLLEDQDGWHGENRSSPSSSELDRLRRDSLPELRASTLSSLEALKKLDSAICGRGRALVASFCLFAVGTIGRSFFFFWKSWVVNGSMVNTSDVMDDWAFHPAFQPGGIAAAQEKAYLGNHLPPLCHRLVCRILQGRRFGNDSRHQ
jgi:hypothetical protein